jgi:DNA replication protein DnaD
MTLLALINVYRKKDVFSLNTLARRIDYPSKEIGLCIDALIEKGFLTIYLETSQNKKTKEVFHLDDMFLKIEAHILRDQEEKKQSSDDQIKKIIIKLEQYLNRILKPFELEQLREMFDVDGHKYDDIYQIIEQLKEQVTIKKIQRMIVLQSRLPQQEVDPETDKALDALYKSIK